MFGMTCFRSDVTRIGGVIKSKPDDFKVTEIDLKGNLVHLNPKEVAVRIDDYNGNGKSGKHQILDSKESTNFHKEFNPVNEETEHSSNNLDSEKHYKNLLSNLNETFYDKISQYSNKCKEEMFGSDHQTVIEAKIPPLCLGIFHDKTQRTILYSSVKYLFPHLKACVSDNHEMRICQDEGYTTFRSLLSEEDTNSLHRFVSRRKVNETLDLSGMPCKVVRTQVHRLVNQHFGSLLESKTFMSANPDGTPKVYIQLRVKERSKGQKRKLDGSRAQVCYTGFAVQKENLETLDAIRVIAKALKVHPSDISYAGIKDKRAVTVQEMAVSLPLQRAEGLLCNFKEKGITVGNIQQRAGPISLGELWGNDFKIILQNIWLPEREKPYANKCPACKEGILKSHFMQTANHLKENGFINYFGKQRFGEEWSSPSGSLAADIGLAMLQKDYIKAVKLILAPDPKKTDTVNSAKKVFQETLDAKAALKMMPPFKARECMLLKALHRHGLEQEGCRKALLGIPHRMRQLYVHSFTSLVWNHMASQRITDHGFEVIPGDLVIPPGTDVVTKDKVVCVSSGDWTETAKYTVRDVVLPLPGNTIKYPGHGVGKAYSDFLNSHGLRDCQFRLNALQINIPGDYRRLVEFPINLIWKTFQEGECNFRSMRKYSASENVKQEVCSSDFLIAELADVSSQDDLKRSEVAVKNITEQANELENMNKICDCGNDLRSAQFNLELNFCLHSSTYATSLLHEILRDAV